MNRSRPPGWENPDETVALRIHPSSGTNSPSGTNSAVVLKRADSTGDENVINIPGNEKEFTIYVKNGDTKKVVYVDVVPQFSYSFTNNQVVLHYDQGENTYKPFVPYISGQMGNSSRIILESFQIGENYDNALKQIKSDVQTDPQYYVKNALNNMIVCKFILPTTNDGGRKKRKAKRKTSRK